MPRAIGELVLTQYVVYDHPADYPDCFVVRAWEIRRGAIEPLPGRVVGVGDTLELARAHVPGGLANIGRQPHDDKTIVEVWT